MPRRNGADTADPPIRQRTLWESLKRPMSRLVGSSPPRIALLAFAVVIAVFTALLMMPWATASGRSAQFHDAVFVATSAVSVTGLISVNTAEHWSLAGQIVILAAIQIGGLGILTLATLVAVSVTHHLGLRTRLVAQEGMATGRLGEVGSLIKTVVVCSVVVEAALAAVLVPRMMMLDESPAVGAWHGLFYSISAFNNAGFVIHPEGLAGIGHDPVVLWTIMVGVFLGSLGFPVLLVLWRCRWHFTKWSLHTKLTMQVTVLLMVLGAVAYALLEWHHADTMGDMTIWEKLQNSLFASIMMRSGGFSVVDNIMEHSETMLVTNALMFVGGGSASTAGGIKVTTFAVILLAFLAEARGQEESTAHGRTIPAQAVRVAISVVAVSATLILVSTLALIMIAGEDLERPLFESISAFATVGLTSGLSAELPPSGLYVLSGLMFAGRVGIMTFAAALTIRHSGTRYRYPEGRPIIG
ncbi:TrkH family potassium uptake protein [Nesterenkonia muleiensis]|uniref:TrkH family potassium uptake protein n=1 Tax=Nesterenkonia muleiensis TaxID=2282648 RepID=UPI001EE40E94|nr:potassium transporter TrkG [Nesterenkonia muleiensis]